jgi:hypothetical protein
METAAEQLRGQLRDGAAGELLGRLPKGEPHKLRRPQGPPSSWPELRPARAAASDRGPARAA